MNQIVSDNLGEIRVVCEQFGVARLELFGSAARNDFDPEKSDVDFIVEFLDYELGISDRFFGLIHALQELLGRAVDLTSARTRSNPYFLDEIEADRVTLYGPEDRSAVPPHQRQVGATPCGCRGSTRESRRGGECSNDSPSLSERRIQSR